jgi:hypothetical protein
VTAPLANSAERALRELEHASNARTLRSLTGAQLLMERARLTGACFADGRSAGGTCRFLPAADATIALNLPRDSDWALIPAWLEVEESAWCWDRLADATRERAASTLIDRARLLGLAAASATASRSPAGLQHPASGRPGTGRPTVVDLSALWAGPLCSHLLALCGADVIKVESTRRPDGARFGNARFYALLNQGKRSVALDFARPAGRAALDALLRSADIVIESSRPRALRQLGIDAAQILADRPGLTWISITGYGRSEPQASWIAFGDDAGVAAGLSAVMKEATGRYQFAGDAIADPLAGIQAALAAWRGWSAGGGGLVSLALADVAARSLAEDADPAAFASWWEVAERGSATRDIAERPVSAPVAELGADTDTVLSERAIRC